MTSDVPLGAADADGRWIGVRRHQALLILAGVGVGFDALVRAGASRAEAVGAVAALAAAAPGPGGETLGQWLVVTLAYLARPKCATVAVRASHDGVDVAGRARVTVRGFRLEIPGRLDLSGRDLEIADALARHLDAIALAGVAVHASLHTRVDGSGATTVLALTGGSSAPAPWVRDDSTVRAAVDVGSRRAATLERWGYVRTAQGPRAVMRVRDFSGVASGRSALERVLLGSDRVGVSVHAEVVDAVRGRRLAERAVHQVRSDGAMVLAAGFRRTARASGAVERTRGREAAVAGGRALVRLAVYVTVRAESRAELAAERERARRLLAESGLVVDRGLGRQRDWFGHQLPGGPGW